MENKERRKERSAKIDEQAVANDPKPVQSSTQVDNLLTQLLKETGKRLVSKQPPEISPRSESNLTTARMKSEWISFPPQVFSSPRHPLRPADESPNVLSKETPSTRRQQSSANSVLLCCEVFLARANDLRSEGNRNRIFFPQRR
jgi:hypothetical protein